MKISNYTNEQIILITITILTGFGLVIMYSASSIIAMNKFNNYLFFFIQQIKWIIIGAILMLAISRINYQYLNKIVYLLIFLSWVFLILGYFFKGSNPAARWLVIGGRSWMTTSDFARISMIIFTAFFIEKNKNKLDNWKYLCFNFTPIISIGLLLILFQPDTSTAIVIGFIIMIMLFIAKANWKYLFGVLAFSFFGIFIKIITTPHALIRIINWNDNQKIQSLNALGTGGILGSGLGDSIIKNGFLPEVHTDFILPIIGEELGFLGIFLLFTLFWFLFNRILLMTKEAPDIFSIFLIIGISTSIMSYFIINSAYVIGFAPTTGLPMPFISYGGSHTIFTLISLGIILNIARRSKLGRNTYYRGITYD